MTAFNDIIESFREYDIDGDGEIEISVQALSHRNPLFDKPSGFTGLRRKLIVVIVESRLCKSIRNSHYSSTPFLDQLLIYKDDLNKEGYDTQFVEMAPYSGANRQDCKTLLAIREFLKAVRNAYSNLEGAILIGSFPEASIIRTWPQGIDEFPGQYRVGCTPFDTNNHAGPKRFEIVLADLDGNWRDIYHERVEVCSYIFRITNTTTVSLSANGTKVTLQNAQVERNKFACQDVFWIQDESCSVNGSTVVLNLCCDDPEVSAADKKQPNPVARPCIKVSRINARSIAVQPTNVDSALDANGKPQVTTAPVDYAYENWLRDADLERRLLTDYFDRNHDFRSGVYGQRIFTISVIESGGLGTFDAEQGLQGLSNFRRETEVDHATLLSFIRWLKTPAIFRVVSSHAGCESTTLLQESEADDALAESEAGGYPWRWINENGYYTPSLKGQSTADLMVFRTLWENGILANLPPSLLMHVGCSVNSVDHPEVPYNQPPYGTFQNAESWLFYANQLAIICHATDWNIGPLGFGYGFAATGATIGDGWEGISEATGQDAQLAQDSTQRKQNYIWSVVGDWTLQKHYPFQGFHKGTTIPNPGLP